MSSHRSIVTASSLEEAEQIRLFLMAYQPRPCVYVFTPSKGNDLYDICISTGIGGYPDDTYFGLVKSYLDSRRAQGDLPDEDIEIEVDFEENELQESQPNA